MEKDQRSSAICVVRIISMLCIVLCHTIHYYKFIPGHAVLGQVFNVGVYVFLLISGYLYGGKTITKFSSWYWSRWQKIVIPMVTVVLTSYLLSAFAGEVLPPLGIVSYLFNVHGFGMISWKLFSFVDPLIDSLGPLWFTTIIMLCYCLVPTLRVLCRKLNNSPTSMAASCITVSLLLAGCFLLIACTGISLIYFVVFSIGYILGNFGFRKDSLRLGTYTGLTIFMAAGLALRLYLSIVLGDTDFYSACAALTHTIFSLWIFVTAFGGERMFPHLTESIAKAKIVMWLDKHSFYIYLTHGLFCMGSALNVYEWFDSICLSSIVFIAISLLAAIIVRIISDWLIAQMKPKAKNEAAKPR